ncbi:hypothetical protein CDG76_12335 [Nostoc sp. 'Peltigera membranacea cyanobiont' 210A]|uniref:nSTAND1 domain-containing NTPase n=1 Tax=Nostoc sp. 'Peltigera membranacea cyanobiont' 210A TaxID=2014529 RepID=UPI000B954B3B|nr:caspase family protein [Nostoc sp. 'Peltigera membranacea cyanobiont' 210A]OYD95714.1 hypothetical protein CDG76_12335 [Nostoc sp. 'Peltigera membranacea cyanobiont' 210A]
MARYALVVGITDYTNQLSNLTKPATDAEAVAQVLKTHGDFEDIAVLKGKVSTNKLAEALKTLLQQQAVKNEALIYFTGHGITVYDSLGTQQAYLATSDLTIVTQGKQIIEQTGGISLLSLNNLIRDSDLSSLVVLLDCCHSGEFLERNLIEKTLTAFISQRDYYFIAACRGFQQAYAKKSEQHSIFTTALLAGLSADNTNDRGRVTGDRLFDILATELKSSGQEPIRMGWGRSITLVRYQPKQTEVVIDETCPYRGLEAFNKEQARFFFGREKVIQLLIEKLGQANFVPVIGASGSGKSSVVRAGLIPALEKNGWQILEITPDIEPLAELRGVFKQYFSNSRQLYDYIRYHPNGLRQVISCLPTSQNFLLVVDQFEEVFTLCSQEEERQRFIELLTEFLPLEGCFEESSRLAIVTTMRADFLEPCLSYKSLTNLIQEQAVYMPPLVGAELEEAIASPANLQGYQLEKGLLGAIQHETIGQEKGCLPLLQFALTELWEQRDRQAHLLTVAKYKKLGGVIGALNRHTEKLYKSFTKQQQDWVKQIFLNLVRTGAEAKDTRQWQPKAKLLNIAGDKSRNQKAISNVLEKLIQGRLIVADTEATGEVWIDLAHEALMEGWQRFANWRQKGRELRRLIDRVEDALREWQKQPKDENLMMGGLLTEVKENWDKLQFLLSPQAKNFYQLSNAFKQHQDAFQQYQIATLEKALTESRLREKAVRVENLLTVQPLNSLMLAIQAMGENLDKLPQQILAPVQNSLNKVTNKAIVSIRFDGHEYYVRSVAISSNGQTIVSGNRNGTVRLWNRQGFPLTEPLRGHENDVSSVAISSDGQMIVSSGSDGTVRLWNHQGLPLAEPLHGHSGVVTSVAISGDGQTIVSGGEDSTVRLWNRQGQSEPLHGHRGVVTSVAISGDGQTIVSGGRDGTVRLWNRQGFPLAEPLRGHEGVVYSVDISGDGQTIVSGGRDGTVRLWNRQGQSLAEPLRDHTGDVSSVAISGDGQTIISGGRDGTVRLWNRQGFPLAEPLRGHEDDVSSVAISSDGQTIVSGGRDGIVQLWNLQGLPLAKSFRNHESWVTSVAISGDGQRIVSGGRDGTVRLWNRQGLPLAEPLRGHESVVNSVAISGDGQRIVSGGRDGTVRLWNLQGLPLTEPLRDHEGSIHSVAISGDGQTIVSGGRDGTVRLWNLQGLPLTEPLRDHEGSIHSVVISDDGQTVVSGGSDSTVRLWNLQGLPLVEPLRDHEGVVNSVVISSDGQTIVSGGSDGTVRLWNLQGQSEPLCGHEGSVYSVAISGDGQTIVSGGRDGTVRLWNLQGQSLAEPLRGHEGSVYSVAISDDGQTIVSGGKDGTVRLWRGGWRTWLQVCCDRLRYHPIFTNPQTEEAKAACEVCRKYVWSKVSG